MRGTPRRCSMPENASTRRATDATSGIWRAIRRPGPPAPSRNRPSSFVLPISRASQSPADFVVRFHRYGPQERGSMMKYAAYGALIAVGLLLATKPAAAHHSFAAEFDI